MSSLTYIPLKGIHLIHQPIYTWHSQMKSLWGLLSQCHSWPLCVNDRLNQPTATQTNPLPPNQHLTPGMHAANTTAMASEGDTAPCVAVESTHSTSKQWENVDDTCWASVKIGGGGGMDQTVCLPFACAAN